MLSKCIREYRRKLKSQEVVAICDHLCFLLISKLKHKIRGKSTPIALYLLIQSLGAYLTP